jgi:outer membrane immunogenic protein
MQRLLVAFLASAAIVGCTLPNNASAADLPARMPVKGPIAPYVLPFSWTGFYVGANAGYGWSSGDGTIAFGGPSGPTSGYGDGILGGAQLGYNWQLGAFVLGAEADFRPVPVTAASAVTPVR